MHEEVQARITAAIAHGDLNPGERLDEIALCEWLGVSRPTVRTALQILTQRGLVESSARRYLRVSRPDPIQLTDGIQVLGALWGIGLRQVLPSVSIELIRAHSAEAEQLAALLRDPERVAPEGSEVILRVQDLFHFYLVNADNVLLSEAAVPVENRVAQAARIALPYFDFIGLADLVEGVGHASATRDVTAAQALIVAFLELGEELVARVTGADERGEPRRRI
ncbi:GntR family transcriptional regulator [Plantibacter flavus]|uniref:GntR family transcriptional regulator n=1 Tax=Plantibacter flavus TaxID=150123 RepID=UPI0013566226|nr:GntR family transcriptional regulator [Plantibacter flavus]